LNTLSKTNAWKWDGEQVVFAGEKDALWGVVEQANGAWAILVDVPGGVLTAGQFAVLAEIMADGGAAVKFTRRQLPILLVSKEKVAGALKKLTAGNLRVASVHGSVRNIVACPGKGLCVHARQETLGLAKEINEAAYGTKLPWDFKIGLSGCPRNCSAALCQCIGLIGEPRGRFTIALGGKESGTSPIHGNVLPVKVPREKVVPVVVRLLALYAALAGELTAKGELPAHPRLYHVIKKAGLEPFISAIQEEVQA
jgi:precorrin-3B C17-methyltransferase